MRPPIKPAKQPGEHIAVSHEKKEGETGEVVQSQFADQRPEHEQQGAIQKMANDFQASNPPVVDPLQKKSNGLPEDLRNGIENLSGFSMDNVNVHYNSSKPAQLQALAFAQGNNIHLGPGQEKHLPHEAWHVVQQKQGRVKPTIQLKTGVPVNDDPWLEREADLMGAKALQAKFSSISPDSAQARSHKSYHQSFSASPVQRLIGFEIEAHYIPVTPYSAAKEPSVTNLLARGVGHDFLGQQATWHRETDHGKIGAFLETERDTWHQAAKLNKANLDRQGGNAAIVEYVTVPFDETQNATYNIAKRRVYALTQMGTTVNEIIADIGKYQGATSSKRKGNYQIGVPNLTAFNAAAAYYGIATPNFAKDSRARIMNEAQTDKTYVQATVGVLPEKIIQFLQKSGDGTQPYNQRSPVSAQDPLMSNNILVNDPGPAYRLIGSAMNRIEPVVLNLVNGLTAKNGLMPTNDAAEQMALRGYLTLVLHVTLGSAIRLARTTGGVDKNMVSFLPKTSLDMIPDALPDSVNPTLLPGAKQTSLANSMLKRHNSIATALQGMDNAITGAMINGTAKGHPLTVPVKQYLREVLSGGQDRFFTTQAAGRPALQPEALNRGGRKGIATGNLVNPNTRAIALETRHYAKMLKAADLAGYANDMKDLMLAAHA